MKLILSLKHIDNMMKKLLLLLFLIPVLSWADCPLPILEWTNGKGEPIIFTEEQNEYKSNLHCEMHRCYKKEIEELYKKFPERKGMDEISPACVCKNLGGLITGQGSDGFGCNDSKTIFKHNNGTSGTVQRTRVLKNFHTHADPEPKPTPTSIPKVSIEDAKVQCSDIGFKTGTERFGECVLELMQ